MLGECFIETPSLHVQSTHCQGVQEQSADGTKLLPRQPEAESEETAEMDRCPEIGKLPFRLLCYWMVWEGSGLVCVATRQRGVQNEWPTDPLVIRNVGSWFPGNAMDCNIAFCCLTGPELMIFLDSSSGLNGYD